MSLLLRITRKCMFCDALVPFGPTCPKCGSDNFILSNHYIEKPSKKKKRPFSSCFPKQYKLF